MAGRQSVGFEGAVAWTHSVSSEAWAVRIQFGIPSEVLGQFYLGPFSFCLSCVGVIVSQGRGRSPLELFSCSCRRWFSVRLCVLWGLLASVGLSCVGVIVCQIVPGRGMVLCPVSFCVIDSLPSTLSLAVFKCLLLGGGG